MESKILEIPRFKNLRRSSKKKKPKEKKEEEERNVCAKKYNENKITSQKRWNRKC